MQVTERQFQPALDILTSNQRGFNMSSTSIYQQIESFVSTICINIAKTRLIKDKNDLFLEAMNFCSHLSSKSPLREILFCLKNEISTHPKCPICGKSCTWNIKQYHKTCSSSCSSKLFCIENNISNISQLKHVKEKKEQNCIEKYGVSNPSKLQSVKNKIQENRTKPDRNKLIEKYSLKYETNDVSFKSYSKHVRKLTEIVYKQNIDIIDPQRLRSKEYHLDHKVSVISGYANKIPAKIMADICNLEIIHSSKNYKKNYNSSMSIHELVELYKMKYGEYNIHKLIDDAPIAAIFKENNGNPCAYCGLPSLYHLPNGKWCCASHRNKCQGERTRNSEGQKKKRPLQS